MVRLLQRNTGKTDSQFIPPRLEILGALVGRIPPNPLWAELLWQKQQENMEKRPT